MTTDEKIWQEQTLLGEMITLYCKGRHGRGGLCSECRGLLEYAAERSERCPHMETKTFCSACKTHCYKPEMREKIRAVMRYSGPRMLFYHPVILMRHALAGKKESKGV